MKTILKYCCYLIFTSAIFGLLLTEGYSDINKFIFFCSFACIAIIEAGLKYGFNKELPKSNISKKIIRAIHLLFGIVVMVQLNKDTGIDIIKSVIDSRSLLILLYFWLIFILFLGFRREIAATRKIDN